MTDHLGQSQVIAYLRQLASHCHGFSLISFEKPERYRNVSDSVREMISGKNINWYPMRYTKYPLILSTLGDLLLCFGKAFFLNTRYKFHIIHCRSHFPAIVGLIMKRFFGAKFIFDMRGWWVDEKLESGHWKSWLFKPVYHLLKWLEKQSLLCSDHLVVLTYSTRNELLQRFPQLAERISVIPTCVDFEFFGEFSNEARVEIRSSLNISEETTVMVYSGSFGGNYEMASLLRLFQVFIERYPSGQFIVLSKTNPQLVSEKLSMYGSLNDKLHLLSVEYGEVHRYLSAGDLGAIFYRGDWSTLGRSPTKLAEYWACGLPVLAQELVGDLSHLKELYPHALTLVDNVSKDSLEKALKKMPLKVEKSELKHAAQEYFGIDNGVHSYREIYSLLAR
jgi:glycosyltransferase involved in cell wall biosynthesis